MDFKNWESINWKELRENILFIQVEIYKAAKEGNKELLRSLQYDLINNPYNKILATRRVTQDNRGRRTPGIDGISKINEEDRIDFAHSLHIDGLCSPIRRIYIPKPNGEKRPLGIPTIKDRAKQSIVKTAIEPEWEAKFEPKSFGFRPGRSAKHALKEVHSVLYKSPKFVLDADIRKCFDRINHETLLNKMDNDPIIKNQIKSWLQAGFHDEFYNETTELNETGTPQGGIISPLLCNIALDGIASAGFNAVLRFKGMSSLYRKSAYSLIRYADDFIAVHPILDVILEIKEEISNFLKPLNLELHPEKTKIIHTINEHNGHKPGFTFLSANYQHFYTKKHRQAKSSTSNTGKKNFYNFKLRSHPDIKSIDKHLESMRKIIKKNKGMTQFDLIKILNPIIRGWTNYFSCIDHVKATSYCDHKLFWYLYKWALHRHPTKGRIWVADKYFHTEVKGFNQKEEKYKIRKWVFGVKQRGYFKIKLNLHTEIKFSGRKYNLAGDYSPYKPEQYHKLLDHFQSSF